MVQQARQVLAQYSSRWVYYITYLVIVSKNPAEALHISFDHFFTKLIISLIHVKLAFVVPLLPACFPQPAKHEKLNSCQSTGSKPRQWSAEHNYILLQNQCIFTNSAGFMQQTTCFFHAYSHPHTYFCWPKFGRL